MEIRVKRVNEPWLEQDGFRVLVDRLWPRGMTKDKARIDLWYKDMRDIARAHEHGPAFIFIMFKNMSDKRFAVAASLILRVGGDIFQFVGCTINANDHANAAQPSVVQSE